MIIQCHIQLLLIEDSALDALYIKETLNDLEAYQFHIYHCQTLTEGITYLKNHSADIALLDLMLPDSSGEETVSKMALHCQNTPFIVLTGFDDIQLGLRAIEKGAQDYLYKGDLNQELLIRVIQHAMERKRNHLELQQAYHSIEKQVQLKTQELQQARDELRELTKRLLTIQEEQQGRISRQVHDVLGQALTGLKIEMEWIENELGQHAQPVKKAIDRTYEMLDELVISVRQISSELRPGILDDLGLVSALDWQINEFKTKTGINCELIINPEDLVIEKDLATTLFRITQEALTNIIRHSQASQVHVFLQIHEQKVNLIIDDNGQGFSLEMLDSPHALGLIGMRERVFPWDGMIDINSTPGRGTEIFVEIPMKDDNNE